MSQARLAKKVPPCAILPWHRLSWPREKEWEGSGGSCFHSFILCSTETPTQSSAFEFSLLIALCLIPRNCKCKKSVHIFSYRTNSFKNDVGKLSVSHNSLGSFSLSRIPVPNAYGVFFYAFPGKINSAHAFIQRNNFMKKLVAKNNCADFWQIFSLYL